MAAPICIAGSLDRLASTRKFVFVDLEDYMDNGGELPEKRLVVTGLNWRAFSLAGLSLILIWQ